MKYILFLLLPVYITMADISGIWTFEAPTAPYGYQKGEIHITRTDDGYTAEMVIGSFRMPAKDMTIDGNKMTCSIMVEGMNIPLSFTFDGDTMTGNANSPDGLIAIKATKKK